MNVLTITLPLPKSSNPNGQHGHWAKKAKARKADRSAAEMEVRSAMGRASAPRWERATIVATWYAKTKAWIPDEGNAHARMKGYIDGMADAGVFVNDKHIRTVLNRDVDKKAPRLVMVIQESR